jgi:hypothetical protein
MSRNFFKILLVFITLLAVSGCTATIPAGSEPVVGIAGEVQAATAIPATPTSDGFDCASVTEIPAQECQALVAFYEATDGLHWLDSSGWLQTTTPCSWLGVTCAGSHIDTLAIFFNNLQGELPASLADLSQLRVLDLHNNAIGGQIPPKYGRLSNLEYIDLSVNQISGPLPETFGNLAALQSLNLAHNQLDGPLPPTLGKASSLRNFDLSYNQFNGQLPASLADLTALETLRLRDNQLDGEIPFSLSELPALVEIDLTFNNLSGTVPSRLFWRPFIASGATSLRVPSLPAKAPHRV